MRNALGGAVVVFFFSSLLAAQQVAQPPTYVPKPAAAVLPAGLADVVKKQFGAEFTVLRDFSTPLLTGDINSDGFEDAVIVARAKDPLKDAAALLYTVVDPYNEYFGYGNTKDTVEFMKQDPSSKLLLIIHGAAGNGWRAETPVKKFVIINLPFDRLGLVRLALSKKKTVLAIATEETSVLTSAVYWNGKKYKWEPNHLPAD